MSDTPTPTPMLFGRADGDLMTRLEDSLGSAPKRLHPTPWTFRNVDALPGMAEFPGHVTCVHDANGVPVAYGRPGSERTIERVVTTVNAADA